MYAVCCLNVWQLLLGLAKDSRTTDLYIYMKCPAWRGLTCNMYIVTRLNHTLDLVVKESLNSHYVHVIIRSL
jgi:hypothetical protein